MMTRWPMSDFVSGNKIAFNGDTDLGRLYFRRIRDGLFMSDVTREIPAEAV
jgi:hypothetical protein